MFWESSWDFSTTDIFIYLKLKTSPQYCSSRPFLRTIEKASNREVDHGLRFASADSLLHNAEWMERNSQWSRIKFLVYGSFRNYRGSPTSTVSSSTISTSTVFQYYLLKTVLVEFLCTKNRTSGNWLCSTH